MSVFWQVTESIIRTRSESAVLGSLVLQWSMVSMKGWAEVEYMQSTFHA